MNERDYYVGEKEKLMRFGWEMNSEIEKATWRAMDDIEKIVESIMPQIKEIIRREAATLKAFVATAEFNDPYLKEAIYKLIDEMANNIEIFVVAGMRRAIRKTFETLRDDVEGEIAEALDGLDLLIVPDR